jgi:8-oxo-dGTP pyrophosphatase MutT (NUDIX family)
MKNFPFKHPQTGEELWYSRSVTVVGLVVAESKNSNSLYVLTTKRGKNCPDEVGKYCLPCGYVDFDETTEEAMSRELYEETGIYLSSNGWNLIKCSSQPVGNQNINLLYKFTPKDDEILYITDLRLKQITTPDFGEVEEVKWMELKWDDSISEFNYTEIDKTDWAFNQKYILKNFI